MFVQDGFIGCKRFFFQNDSQTIGLEDGQKKCEKKSAQGEFWFFQDSLTIKKIGR